MNTKKLLFLFFLLGVIPILNCQVFIAQDFNNVNNGTNWTLPGWTNSRFNGASPNSCDGKSIRANCYSTGNFSKANFQTPAQVSKGNPISIEFKYKITNYSGGGGNLITGTWGNLKFEHKINGGAYVTDTTITQNSTTTSCATVTLPALQIADGDTVRFRISATRTAGDWWVYIDDLNIVELVTCPQSLNLALKSADDNSATISWDTLASNPTAYQFQYGEVGFDLGEGTTTTPVVGTEAAYEGKILNLPTDSFYHAYVRVVCDSGDTSGWSGPILFNTFNQKKYIEYDRDCGDGFMDISQTGTDTNLTDLGSFTHLIPFSILYQNSLYTNNVRIYNDGGIRLGTTGFFGYTTNITSSSSNSLYVFADDFDNESGTIYYETVGTAPNRKFIVQWNNRPLYNGTSAQTGVTFQCVIEERTSEIYYRYKDVIFGESKELSNNGATAKIGLSGNQDVVFSNEQASVYDNECIHFYYTDCPKPKNGMVTSFTKDSIILSWQNIGDETAWDVNYGAEGFNPDNGGTTTSESIKKDTIAGLNQLTTYDVYIRANCGTEKSKWLGPIRQKTAPACANPTNLTSTIPVGSNVTSVDSVGFSFTDNANANQWNVQYGAFGFKLGSGTTKQITNKYDTIPGSVLSLNQNGQQVYQIYVQANCAANPGDTSEWIGPLEVILSDVKNDSVCEPIELPVDGKPRYYNCVKATIQSDEVQPPNKGLYKDDGWASSSIKKTTWFTFKAPATGIVDVSTKDQDFDGNIAVYKVDSCHKFTTFELLGANEAGYYFISSSSRGSRMNVCGLEEGEEYYLMHSSDNSTGGNYSISITEVSRPEAGTTTDINLCAGDTLNLNNQISGNEKGQWFAITSLGDGYPSLVSNDSLFANTSLLAYQTYEFEYLVEKRCAHDSARLKVTTFGNSSAGVPSDEQIESCIEEEFNLFNGLTGSVDLGGVWLDASSDSIEGTSVKANTIEVPGVYNFTYIVSNGVCPADTAKITVKYDKCSGIKETLIGETFIYPNPTDGIFNILNKGNASNFDIIIEDVNGKIIYNSSAKISSNAIKSIDLSRYETGVYIVGIRSNGVVKQHKIILK